MGSRAGGGGAPAPAPARERGRENKPEPEKRAGTRPRKRAVLIQVLCSHPAARAFFWHVDFLAFLSLLHSDPRMADFSDMDMDFDEQLGLEDEHLAGIGEMDYMDVPTEFEPIAELFVLPERENDENRHVVHTMEEDIVSEEPTSLAVETPIVENSPPRRHRLQQKTTVAAESIPPGRHRLRKKTKVLGSPIAPMHRPW